MKVTFITPAPDLSGFGVRAVSAYLKEKGIESQIIFLRGGTQNYARRENYIYRFSQKILDGFVELCSDSQVVGISLMTNYFDHAVQITGKLKEKLPIPIVWGGIHPTVRPEESLRYADAVCIGEGEEAMLDMVSKLEKGEDYTDVNNLWVKENGKIIKNRVRPLLPSLDYLPFYDFDLDNHYAYDPFEDKIFKLDVDLMSKFLPPLKDLNQRYYPAYRTMASRGCPHHCSYCAIRHLKEIYGERGFMRWRSPEGIVEEVSRIKSKFPFIGVVSFFDDTFFARSSEEIKKFSHLYKKQIGLPFHAQCSPTTISEEKMECLIDAGMVFTEMGVQSISQRTRELYNRNITPAKIKKAVDIIHKYQDRLLPPDYHFILDNPWETTEETLKTLHFLLSLPGPYTLLLSSLVCYPGTTLYEKGKKEGVIKDEMKEIYRKELIIPKTTYLNFLFYLADKYNAPGLVKLLAAKRLVKLLNRDRFNSFGHLLIRLSDAWILLIRGIKAILHGDFRKILIFLRKID